MLDNSKKEAISHKNWFNKAFSKEEVEQLRQIGIECKADHNFFNFEILDIFGCITNRKLKKFETLYARFIDRYIALIPSFLRIYIDRDMLENDQYYAAWFFNRHSFFEVYKRALETPSWNGKHKVLWSPVLDIYTPKECYLYANKLFDMDDVFLEQAVAHWEKPRRGCRCALLTVRESSYKTRLSSGQYELWDKKST
ncbi:hypothetical protein [Acinetobacter thermotolerans]|uniref:hypothetical protein n=1 Tax=Acinetobacter thermotolerans TaxID=3151487 RepID=UPI00325AB016